MIHRLRKLNANTISMWVNILGFIAGIIFYVRMERKGFQDSATPLNHGDSLGLIILDYEHLKASQDSLLKEIRRYSNSDSNRQP